MMETQDISLLESETATPCGDIHPPVTQDCAVAELVFDSAMETTVAGLRGAAVPARHLLYRFGSVCVDMCMQPELGTQHVVLLGQLLDSQQPGYSLGDVTVSLLSSGDAVSHQKTNSVGEFCFGFKSIHAAQLVFGMGKHKKLVVPLPDAD